jgi:hypothetical protein
VKRWVLRIAVIAVALFGLAQAVPYGRGNANPPVKAEPRWDSPRTRELAVRACFDCHSNPTTWPWYSNVAPVSWLTQRDVDGGRAVLNFSEWGPGSDLGEAAEAARDGEMPPWYYKPLHPRARLSSTETDALVAGLVRMLRGGAGR